MKHMWLTSGPVYILGNFFRFLINSMTNREDLVSKKQFCLDK